MRSSQSNFAAVLATLLVLAAHSIRLEKQFRKCLRAQLPERLGLVLPALDHRSNEERRSKQELAHQEQFFGCLPVKQHVLFFPIATHRIDDLFFY